jgi:hypothetical protein
MVVVENDWCQIYTGGNCEGGEGDGQFGDGQLCGIRFRALRTGTSEIAFWTWGSNVSHPRLMSQIKDWDTYYNYSYPGSPPLLWGGNVTVNVTP